MNIRSIYLGNLFLAGCAVCTINPSPPEADAAELWVWGHSSLHSEF